MIDVTSYGAVGDGVTDDTAAIQSAISALAPGGVLFFPSGVYKLTSSLVAGSSITFRGEGDTRSELHQSTTNADGISGVDVSYLTIEDLRIVGTNSGTGTGIKFTRSVADATPFLNFKNVTVYQFGGDGIELSNPIVSTFERVNAVDNIGKGFNIHGVSGGSAGTSCAFTACYANANGGDGWHIEDMVYTFFGGCAADHNYNGYHFKNCQSINTSGSGAEGNTARDFWVEGGYSITLVSPWIYDCRGVGINLSGNARMVTIIGATDNTPSIGATNFIKVTVGSQATLMNCNNTSPNLLSAGTTTIIDPSYGIAASGDLLVSTVGKGLRVKEGTDCKQGTAVLSAGSVVVANTSVTANSRIFLTSQVGGGTPGFLRVSARTAGVSFTIQSSSATDGSTVAYQIFEPA